VRDKVIDKVKTACVIHMPTKSSAPLYPHLHLLVSGGNSQLIFLKSWKDWQVVGKTKDDAAGECFDKVGRMLGLLYPGGVWLSKIAGLEDKNYCKFPVGMKLSNDFDYSFSGMKTAVRYFLQKQKTNSSEYFRLEEPLNQVEIDFLIKHNLEDLKKLSGGVDLDFKKLVTIKEASISAQSAIVEALVYKLKLAERELQPTSIGLSGGVSANPLLRQKLISLFGEKVLIAPKHLTGDNAVMIALAGLLELKN
jgi:N6-L-threonylcarbamoyladenine synthase